MTGRISLAWACAAALAVTGCASGRAERRGVVGAQKALARELVRERSWQRALAVTEALCREAPRDAEARYLRGVVFREQRVDDAAELDLKEAVKLRPSYAEAHAALGILYDLQGRAADAGEHHARAVELEPESAAFLNNLGFSLFVRGRPREAVPVLERALRSAPSDPRIRNNLGFALAAAGDLTRAADQFALGGTPAQARNNLGWAYEQRGLRERAAELYREAARLDPSSAVARENLERIAIAGGGALRPGGEKR